MKFINTKQTDVIDLGGNSYKMYISPTSMLRQHFRNETPVVLVIAYIYFENDQFRLKPYIKVMEMYNDNQLDLEKSDWVKEWVREIKECYNTLPKKKQRDLVF